jgi:hypothetical protein
MACENCSIDRVIQYHVLTRLGDHRHLCGRCAGEHGIVPPDPPTDVSPVRSGPAQQVFENRLDAAAHITGAGSVLPPKGGRQQVECGLVHGGGN